MVVNISQDLAIAYVHFYVDNLPFWQQRFQSIFGLACRPAQTLFPHLPSGTVLLKSPDLQFVLSAPQLNDEQVGNYLNQHPCGVADVAFFASPTVLLKLNLNLSQPTTICNPVGFRHTLIPQQEIHQTNSQIDHLVLNVAQGELEKTLAWYEEKLGFQQKQSFHIQTNYSGLTSRVLRHPSGIQLPINQPGDRRSQIQEFLDYNRGAGIQHIAIKQQNLPTKICELRQQGLDFLPLVKQALVETGDSKDSDPLFLGVMEQISPGFQLWAHQNKLI